MIAIVVAALIVTVLVFAFNMPRSQDPSQLIRDLHKASMDRAKRIDELSTKAALWKYEVDELRLALKKMCCCTESNRKLNLPCICCDILTASTERIEKYE